MRFASLARRIGRASAVCALGLGLGLGSALAQSLDPVTGDEIPAPATLNHAFPTFDPAALPERGGSTLELVKHIAEGETRGLAVVGDVLYRSNGGYLEALNISNLDNPVLLSRVKVEQSAVYGAVVRGNYAYMVTVRAGAPFQQRAGLYVVDVSNPSAMEIVGEAVGQSAYGLTVEGDYAFVGAATSGFSVYDISNPTAPARVTTLATGGSMLAVALNEDATVAYAPVGGSGFRVIGLENPTAPTVQAVVETDGFATNVAYADGVAYVLVNGVGMIAIDVTETDIPEVLGTYQISDSQLRGIDFAGPNRMIVTGQQGLHVVDISDPAAMTQVGTVAFGRTGAGQSATVVGTTAYVGNRFDGVRVVDFATETAPEQTHVLQNGGFSFKVFTQGNYAYVSDLIGEYRIIDLSDPANARVVGRAPALPNTSNSVVRDGIAYVVDRTGDGTSGISYYDVSDPTNPTLINTYVTGGQSFGIDLVGETAFIANGFFSFLSMDLGQTPPVVLENVNPGSSAYDVRVRDDVAYVANFGGGLVTFDVSNPSAMVPLSVSEVGGFASSLAFGADGILHLADGTGLTVVDASDPAAPVSLGSVASAATAVGVAYADGFAYLAEDGYGLRQVDVSNPANPTLAATFVSTDRMTDVAVAGDLIVAVDAGGGVFLFRNPSVVSAEGEAAPASFVLDSVYPNPFSAGATVRYFLPEAGAVRVNVYSLLGQRVATLVDGAQGSGWNEATLNASGLASGTYLVRVEAGGQSAVRRVTLVR